MGSRTGPGEGSAMHTQERTEQHNEQTLKHTLQVPVSLIGTRDTVTDLQELQGEDSRVARRQTQPTGSSVTGFCG